MGRGARESVAALAGAKSKERKTLMNMNDVARAICTLEGGKVNLPIAQVKEVLSCARRLCRGSNEAWYCVGAFLRYEKKDSLVKKAKPKKKAKKNRK